MKWSHDMCLMSGRRPSAGLNMHLQVIGIVPLHWNLEQKSFLKFPGDTYSKSIVFVAKIMLPMVALSLGGEDHSQQPNSEVGEE